MRYFLFMILLIAGTFSANAQDEPEIVIELTGSPSAPAAKNGIEIWDKNCRQLAKLLNEKTREYALYQITNVSTKDNNIWAADGTRYRFVQYGKDANYRKFLFRAKEPQTFVACAANTEESLDMTFEYQVDIGLTETEFLETYAAQASSVYLPIDDGQTLYQIPGKDKNPQFVRFVQGKPAARFDQAQANQFIQQEQQRIKQLAKDKQKAREQEAKKKRRNASRTALLEGGTLYDRMYMPRVITPSSTQYHPANNKRPAKPLWPPSGRF